MNVWTVIVPLVGSMVAASFPVASYVQRRHADRTAAEFLGRAQEAQEAFRQVDGRGGYATRLESLTTACPGVANARLPVVALTAVADVGFDVRLRAARGSETGPSDCHGHPTASNYLLSLQPASVTAPTQRAFAASRDATGVFFDGVAPEENELGPAGVATPLASLDAFRIP